MVMTWIPLLGIAIPMVIVPAALFAKHLGRKAQHRHLERMHALKAGMALPPTVPLPGPGSIIALGAGVPMACVLGACVATDMIRGQTEDLPALTAIIWSFALFIAVCGLGSALVLGVLLHRANARAEAAMMRDSAKPTYDPDMFDPAQRAY